MSRSCSIWQSFSDVFTRWVKYVIHLYHGNASLLFESLEVIQRTSAVILAALESSAVEETMPYAELAKVA